MNINKLAILWTCLMIIGSEHVPAQNIKNHDSVFTPLQVLLPDDQIEKSAENLETEADYSDVADDISEQTLKKVNLNNAKEEELNTLPFLTPENRRNLFQYVSTYGEVLSLYELQSIPGFDSALVEKIRPYIVISPAAHLPAFTPKNLLRFGHHDLLLRFGQLFPKATAYLDDDTTRARNPDAFYPGNPQRYYFRYNYTWFDKLRIGLAGEKDPGEQFFTGAQSKGMDYYAAFLSLSNIGILRNLVIGNFRVSYGQGLTMGSGLSLGSVPGFSNMASMATGIRPGLGMNEVSYLRGLATTIKIKGVEISGFVSRHPRDATVSISDSISSQAREISSFTATGYHRTTLELSKRDVLTELVCGGNINFSMAPVQQFGFKIGLTGLFYKYSASLMPVVYPYNQFVFRGKQNLNNGFDFQVRFRGLYFFGEISRSINNGYAFLAGTMLNPDPRVSISLIYRNYQPVYQNLFANSFGQNSINANERGIYAAISAAINARVKLSGYIDFFSFPWLKYRVDVPSQGQEYGMMLGWQASGKVLINLRYYQKNEKTDGTALPDSHLHSLNDILTRDFRIGIECVPGNGIILKTRIEMKEAGESVKQRPMGYLVYQEAQIKALKCLKNITLRFALFDTPAYPCRIYVYEPEVLYGYSVPAYQGQGTRTCVVLKFGIAKKIDLWIRSGITTYTDRQEVGTGPDITQGSVRAELTGQILVKL